MLDLSNIHIVISDKWGSIFQNNRFSIRQDILGLLNRLKIRCDRHLLMDVSLRPTIKKCSVSISHSKQLGGYILALGNGVGVGFDIEQSNRVTKRAVERIGISSCGSYIKNKFPDLIWAAKEASFKAMSNVGKKVLLKDIFIDNIEYIKNHAFYYRFNGIGHGICFRHRAHAISMSRLMPFR